MIKQFVKMKATRINKRFLKFQDNFLTKLIPNFSRENKNEMKEFTFKIHI